MDHCASGSRTSLSGFDRAPEAPIDGETLVVTTLYRLVRSTQNMLAAAAELRSRDAGRLDGGVFMVALSACGALATLL